MATPIERIDNLASTLTEEEVDSLVPELMEHFSGKIHTLSTYVYGSEKGIALEAFKEWAKKTVDKGVRTFVFKNQHWRKGRSIGPYLSTCLSKLADSIKTDIDFVKRVSVPVCPACKTLNDKEFLTYEGKLLRCPTCTKEYTRLEEKERVPAEEFEFRLRKVFSLHSRKGRRCPACERFIPESFIATQGSIRVSCPYDNCSWFGISSELEPMPHPLAMSSGMTVSINAPLFNNTHSSGAEFGDCYDSKSITPDIRIEQSQRYTKELEIARNVLRTQKTRSLGNTLPALKKQVMYEAFEALLEQDPFGMIGYLIRGKCIGEKPIQSMIFQKYIELMENRLPLTIKGSKEDIEVFSLLDSNLNIFLGQSEFQALVRESGFVSNNTHEIFVGVKCNGPCFIGMLCDVLDENGKSLLSEVEYYTFSNIKMKQSVPENTLVKVIHFRIPPHYEMYSLVNLQRVTKRIKTSIQKRLGNS